VTAFDRAAVQEDVRFLRRVIDRWWASRTLHIEVDCVNPDQVFDDLDVVIEDLGAVEQLAVVLRDRLWHLGDGHLRLGAPHETALELRLSGLVCEPVGSDLVVTAAAARDDGGSGHGGRGGGGEGPAPARGHRIVEVDGRQVDDYLAGVRLRPGSTPAQRRWNAAQSLVWQERFPWEETGPGSVTVESADGRRAVVPLAWQRRPTAQATPHCVTGRMLDPDIGLLTVRSFLCRDSRGQVSDDELVRQSRAAAAALATAGSLLVDLRHNGGGRDEQARLIAGMLLPEPIEWMRVHHRDPGTTAGTGELVVDRLEPGGELAGLLAGRHLRLLTGPGSASTSEILVAALRQRPDIEVWGAATAGSVGDPVEFRLPMSGLAFTVPVAVFYEPGSTSPIEAHGVAPDRPLPVSADDVRASADPVLARALAALCATPAG